MSYDLDRINGQGAAAQLAEHRNRTTKGNEALKKERLQLLGSVAAVNSGIVPTVEAQRIGGQARFNTSSVTAITETGRDAPEDTVAPGSTVFSTESQPSMDGGVTVNPSALVRQPDVAVNMPPRPGIQEPGQLGQPRGH